MVKIPAFFGDQGKDVFDGKCRRKYNISMETARVPR